MYELCFSEAEDLRTITLSRLERLQLGLGIAGEEVNAFLACLDIPKTVNIQIWDVTFEDVEDYLLLTRLFMLTTVEKEETSLQFNVDTLSSGTRRRHGLPWDVKWRLEDTLLLNMDELAAHIPLIAADSFLDNITHIAILPNDAATVDDWENILHSLPRVHTLEVCNHARSRSSLMSGLREVFRAVGNCFDEADQQPLYRMPLPELSTINFSRDTVSDDISLSQLVVECLRTRAFANLQPIRTLYLESFDRVEEDLTTVQNLHKFVDNVVRNISG